MLSLKQARARAAQMTELHGKPWLVFETPADALCNQHPFNIYSTGRYAACEASERADYEAGGAKFID